jgi:hypothetical protein
MDIRKFFGGKHISCLRIINKAGVIHGVFHRIQDSLFYIEIALHDGRNTRRFSKRGEIRRV